MLSPKSSEINIESSWLQLESSGGKGVRFRISSYLQGPPYLHPGGFLSSFLIWAVGH